MTPLGAWYGGRFRAFSGARMNRIDGRFAGLRKQGRKGFVYVGAGRLLVRGFELFHSGIDG